MPSKRQFHHASANSKSRATGWHGDFAALPRVTLPGWQRRRLALAIDARVTAMAWIGPNQTATRSNVQAAAIPVAGAGDEAARAFLRRVYFYMSTGLAVTGLMALAVVASPAALQFIYGTPFVFPALLIGELLMVMAFAPVAARVSARNAALMFFAYAALSGVTFSVIFFRYTKGAIGGTFLITATMFASLSAYGAATKRDLSSVGSFCFMGLVGFIIASVVNLFLGSSLLYWLATFVGVIVFTGLTVYDTARLKELALAIDARDGEAHAKGALQGALILYLDFVNLFLLLLRIFGRRR
jgi:FtsH-binding integral membrane protein